MPSPFALRFAGILTPSVLSLSGNLARKRSCVCLCEAETEGMNVALPRVNDDKNSVSRVVLSEILQRPITNGCVTHSVTVQTEPDFIEIAQRPTASLSSSSSYMMGLPDWSVNTPRPSSR